MNAMKGANLVRVCSMMLLVSIQPYPTFPDSHVFGAARSFAQYTGAVSCLRVPVNCRFYRFFEPGCPRQSCDDMVDTYRFT